MERALRRSTRPRRPAAVVVHALAHALAAARAAEELGTPVILLSPPDGAVSFGAGWFKAVVERARAAHPRAAVGAILDCGDRPDLVQAALRHGIGAVCFRGPAAVRRKLADIAAQYGARLHAARPPALDLIEAAGAAAACRDWLAGAAGRAGGAD
ncbi:MAG: hypothetical protein IRY94_06530 [Rhodospirillaceae bacterium]|nr:hypothetical protein [Rhodospirillaceae bacterium]